MPPVVVLAICAVILFGVFRYYHFSHLELCLDELKTENCRLRDAATALWLDLELADPNAHSLEIAEQVFAELRSQPALGEDFANYLATFEKRVTHD